MLLSVTAPRKGMGQTLTSINIAAAITQLLKDKVMLIDVNKHYRDVENYLSDTKITKGLDDFISLHNSNLLNKESFKACVKINKKIDIMSTNECLELDNNIMNVLLEYTEIFYKTIIIDTISGENVLTHNIFRQSDYVIVVLNQSKHILDFVCKSDLYKPYKGKLVFIVNRFIDKFEDKKINLGLSQIIGQLNAAGYGDFVFPLAFDMDVINECNDNAILNRVLNSSSDIGKYSKQLNEIANCLLKDDCRLNMLCENKKKSSLLSFFRVKGVTPFAS